MDTQSASSGTKSGDSCSAAGSGGPPAGIDDVAATPLTPNEKGVRYFCSFADAGVRYSTASFDHFDLFPFSQPVAIAGMSLTDLSYASSRTATIGWRNLCQAATAERGSKRPTYNGDMQNGQAEGSVTSSGPSRSPSQSHSQSRVARRWTVIASGLLLLALALIVIYTGPSAFYSPIALVVVAAIGLAALLLQVRFRRDLSLRSPLWLNTLGIVCALISLFADFLRITWRTTEAAAFSAVVCFGISGSLILSALRRRRASAPQSPPPD
jgi:hypothetical protein